MTVKVSSYEEVRCWHCNAVVQEARDIDTHRTLLLEHYSAVTVRGRDEGYHPTPAYIVMGAGTKYSCRKATENEGAQFIDHTAYCTGRDLNTIEREN